MDTHHLSGFCSKANVKERKQNRPLKKLEELKYCGELKERKSSTESLRLHDLAHKDALSNILHLYSPLI